MELKVDAHGRLVLPAELMDRLGLMPGYEVVTECGGGVLPDDRPEEVDIGKENNFYQLRLRDLRHGSLSEFERVL